jgi:hypothetical protein
MSKADYCYLLVCRAGLGDLSLKGELNTNWAFFWTGNEKAFNHYTHKPPIIRRNVGDLLGYVRRSS